MIAQSSAITRTWKFWRIILYNTYHQLEQRNPSTAIKTTNTKALNERISKLALNQQQNKPNRCQRLDRYCHILNRPKSVRMLQILEFYKITKLPTFSAYKAVKSAQLQPFNPFQFSVYHAKQGSDRRVSCVHAQSPATFTDQHDSSELFTAISR